MSSDKIGYAVYYNVLVVCRFGDSPDPECRSTTSTIAESRFFLRRAADNYLSNYEFVK